MIYQISPVKTQTGPLPTINKGLLQVRHIQAQVKDRTSDSERPVEGYILSPFTAGPFVVPVTRWIE
jgi:hypothetical protein